MNAPKMMVGLGLVPLSEPIGAEIVGLDLHAPLDDETFARVHDAWLRHSVLVFRGQDLGEDAQIGFARRFGELAPLVNAHEGRSMHPAVMLISNIREDGRPIGALPDGEMFFHSDQCYIERPSKATLLYAIEVPRAGGNTIFASTTRAYETLPEAMRRRLDGLTALNVYDYAANPTKPGETTRPDAPQFAHPVVRTHPETGRKALYVNRLMTAAVVGWPKDESDALLSELFDHQEQRRFLYEHVWRPGDLVVWDNRSTLHARTDFSPSERRLLRRVAVRGERPV